MLNAELIITKMNKSAEVLLNMNSEVTVGKRITEVIGARNSHLMRPITEVSQSVPYANLLKTQISTSKGSQTASGDGSNAVQTVNINFHVTKLTDPAKKLHALCLVLQPVIVVAR